MGVSGAYLCGGSEGIPPFPGGNAPGSGGEEEFRLLPTGAGCRTVPSAGRVFAGSGGLAGGVPPGALPGGRAVLLSEHAVKETTTRDEILCLESLVRP